MSTKARGQSRRVYITGDTLTGPHLDDIARRFGPVDTVVAHLGGTRILFNTVTVDAREGLALLRQVPAKRSIAIHYDDYGVFRSPVRDFVDLVSRSDVSNEIILPGGGATPSASEERIGTDDVPVAPTLDDVDRADELLCCAPARESELMWKGTEPALSTVTGSRIPQVTSRHTVEQCSVPAQVFAMGDAQGDGKLGDGERPVHDVAVQPFSVDATPVTNADFERFVAATEFVTEAESFGFSAVFHLAVAAPAEAVMGPAAGTPWWFGVWGADWRHPGGPESGLDGLEDHPVVHVSWNDAQAYCAWAKRALPTEAQWECASRGGRAGQRYPWGDQLESPRHCNIWQGRFPVVNTLDDGYLTTAPVRTFQPNDYGLWQTVGNVWEWCADWWSPFSHATSSFQDPTGPDQGAQRVMRGGSYLCHDSYCNRYRNAARSSNTADSSMGNTGFRTVALP